MAIEDKAFGVVPVSKTETGEYEFLMVYHKLGHWAFPKGHQNDGESAEETIRRELYEETGVRDIKIDFGKEFVEKHSFKSDEKTFNKTNVYFLGFTDNADTKTQEDFKHEIKEMRWALYKDAFGLLTYPEAKVILRDVSDYLLSRRKQ